MVLPFTDQQGWGCCLQERKPVGQGEQALESQDVHLHTWESKLPRPCCPPTRHHLHHTSTFQPSLPNLSSGRLLPQPPYHTANITVSLWDVKPS